MPKARESHGFPSGAGFYAASKAGLRGMSRSMAGELAPRGIRVNVVAPDFIKAPIWERAPLPPKAAAARAKKLQEAIPLDRWGESEEVAKAVLFLASDDSSYVHSSEIIVDGGVIGTMFAAPVYR